MILVGYALLQPPPNLAANCYICKRSSGLCPVADGFTKCHEDLITIEAIVNPCAKLVTSTLTGPDGSNLTRTDEQALYTIFSDDANTPMGRELPVGSYTFTAVPHNVDYKKQNITFRVKKC